MKEMNYTKRRVGIPHYPWPVTKYDTDIEKERIETPPEENEKALLYVHIPFCDHICSFCPYPKIKNTDHVREVYFDSLKKEIIKYSSQLNMKHRPIEAVYFGGGTPSVLSTQEIENLFKFIRKHLNLDGVKEITFESNPHSLSREKIKLLKELGGNRISMGTQTFNEKISENIGLIQKPVDSFKAIEYMKRVGIDNISIDLMYNLPGQSMGDWENDLATADKLCIDHVSLFPLKLLPFLGLYKRILTGEIPESGGLEYESLLFIGACQYLEAKGYDIVSTYDLCKPGKKHIYAGKHFKEHYDLLAVGLGSFGEVDGFVYKNKFTVNEYCNTLSHDMLPVDTYFRSTDKHLPRRLMSMGLRLLKVDLEEFQKKCGGLPSDFFSEKINKLKIAGLIEEKEGVLALVRWDGILWGNNICFEFVDELFTGLYPP